MTYPQGNWTSSAPGPREYDRAASEYQIQLNFLPIVGELPSFTVYRKATVSPQEERPSHDIRAYSLPEESNAEGRRAYWVSVEPVSGFLPWEAAPEANRDLTRRVLYWSLLSSANRHVDPAELLLARDRFVQELSFIQRSWHEGDELLVVQPYYLRATSQFGYLVDFHFHLREGIPFSKRVQQLSLSLRPDGRRNLDYYADRLSKVQSFVRGRADVLRSLRLPQEGGKIQLAADMSALPGDRLRSKVYVFAGNRESKSQFNGLRECGPLQPLDSPPRLLFVFREKDRGKARMLALSLRGSRLHERYSFPGFKVLFKTDIEVDSDPVAVADFTNANIKAALERVRNERQGQTNVVPVLVLPSDDDDAYLTQKALFTHEGIPTQVCTLDVLQDEDTLKWAIANLALQVFCKSGGFPWKVRPTADRTLIIGIGQSHKVREHGGSRIVERYFAFSVMTDSSGLFQKVQVLGEDPNEDRYMGKLRQNLGDVLRQNAGQFSRVVVHTSFKLKHREIGAIHDTVRDAAAELNPAECKFAVVKVNQRSRFFGVNHGVNSLVPYEATKVKLGPGEYLVWFEGIFPDRPTVTKVFPGPTHLQILRVSDQPGIPDDVLLQDLVNLSGANWRGFNAKSTPISVFYCHLVADFVQKFHERELPLPKVEDMRPWFL